MALPKLVGSNYIHQRMRNDEPFDEVNIKIVPRFKTSGLSGDEWRTSAHVVLKSKGVEVAERAYLDVESALSLLPAYIVEITESVDYDYRHKAKEGKCDQPGCNETATTILKLKELFSREGHKLDASDYFGENKVYYRQFCEQHKERGDCSREDCDDNYEVIIGSP